MISFVWWWVFITSRLYHGVVEWQGDNFIVEYQMSIFEDIFSPGTYNSFRKKKKTPVFYLSKESSLEILLLSVQILFSPLFSIFFPNAWKATQFYINIILISYFIYQDLFFIPISFILISLFYSLIHIYCKHDHLNNEGNSKQKSWLSLACNKDIRNKAML